MHPETNKDSVSPVSVHSPVVTEIQSPEPVVIEIKSPEPVVTGNQPPVVIELTEIQRAEESEETTPVTAPQEKPRVVIEIVEDPKPQEMDDCARVSDQPSATVSEVFLETLQIGDNREKWTSSLLQSADEREREASRHINLDDKDGGPRWYKRSVSQNEVKQIQSSDVVQ